MSGQLSETLQRTLDAIAEYEARCGEGPTARELGRTLGLMPATASWHARVLRELGLVTWDAKPGGREPGRARVVRQADGDIPF